MDKGLRRLEAQARPAVLAHLLALDDDDRYMRFGAAVRDAGIRALVARLDFERDLLLGLEAEGRLVGLAHVGFGGGVLAELALSVLPPWRRRGLARILFGRAARLAKRVCIAGFACIHGHPATLRIAHGFGLPVRFSHNDPRVVIYLNQP